jgi:hypothetical protein
VNPILLSSLIYFFFLFVSEWPPSQFSNCVIARALKLNGACEPENGRHVIGHTILQEESIETSDRSDGNAMN